MGPQPLLLTFASAVSGLVEFNAAHPIPLYGVVALEYGVRLVRERLLGRVLKVLPA